MVHRYIVMKDSRWMDRQMNVEWMGDGERWMSERRVDDV